MAVRKQTASASENKRNSIYSEISDELSDFKNDIVQQTIQRTSENDLVRDNKKHDRWQRELTGGG